MLLGDLKLSSSAYFEVLEHEFIGALRTHDDQVVARAFKRLNEVYEQHRIEVDKTVEVASRYASKQLVDLNDTSRRAQWLLGSVGGACLLFVLVIYVFVARRIKFLLGAEPAELRKEMEIFASGDLRHNMDEAPPGQCFVCTSECTR